MPFHGWPGLVVITGADALLFAGHETVGAWFTPIVWTGYVLLVGALVARLTGRSYLLLRAAVVIGAVFVTLPLVVVSVWLALLVRLPRVSAVRARVLCHVSLAARHARTRPFEPDAIIRSHAAQARP